MKLWHNITEMFGSSLRSSWRVLSGTFFPDRPMFDRTRVDYDLARELYRNDAADTHLGAGFARPIIDRSVEFIGIPTISSDDETVDANYSRIIERFWQPQLIEMFRNSMRDSKTIVRLWQPLASDKLSTEEERTACQLQIIDPERVTLIYDPRNPKVLSQAIVVSFVEMRDDVQPDADPARGARPQVKEHEIWEIVEPDVHQYYDRTENRYITEWQRTNPYGFVPFLEVFNEYDSALSGGQSDLEGPYPFIKAFHEVLLQALQAHKYHSMPKLKFKVSNMAGFLRNNYPDTVDENGQVIPGSSISWKGKEVLFLGEQDDIGFIEAKAVLGDSKILLEFLIDCISIASETPEWAFMRVEGGTSTGSVNGQTIPFEKKTERKRIMYQPYIQTLVKMCMAINNEPITNVSVLWPEIRTETLLNMAQAVEQLVMSFEVLLERKLISENTARESLRTFPLFRKMKPPAQEAKDAEGNLSLSAPDPLALPPGGNGNGNGNGKVKTKTLAISGRNGGGKNE